MAELLFFYIGDCFEVLKHLRNSTFLRRFTQILLVLTFLVIGLESAVQAQIGNLTRYEFRAGFYGGPAMYIGEYNPWRFGDPFTYGDPETTTASYGGEINYGAFLNLRLTHRIFLRTNLEFGNLRYIDEDMDYIMSTPYSTLQLKLDFKGNPNGRLRPYLSTGYGLLNFRSPAPNTHPDFLDFESTESGTRISASVIPITFGMEYHITERTALFTEAGFHLTTTDQLDNFRPPESDFTLSNDAFMSFRFGLSMEILRRSTLPVRVGNIPEAKALDTSGDFIALEKTDPDLFEPIPVDELIAEQRRIQEEAALAEELAREEEERLRREEEERLALEEEQRRLQEERERELAIRDSLRLAEGRTPVVRIVDPEERDFEPERALDELEEIREERRRLADLGEIDLSRWDPSMPVIVTTPNPIAQDMIDESGIAITAPPQGYYVQVFASVGPISASRARDLTIAAMGDILEDAQRQVIITRRQQFYEVRIGVFDSYDDTIAVLREIQGTFVDSYTLIYIPSE